MPYSPSASFTAAVCPAWWSCGFYRTANGTVIESTSRYFSARAVFLTITRNFGQSLRIKPKSDPDVPQQGPPG